MSCEIYKMPCSILSGLMCHCQLNPVAFLNAFAKCCRLLGKSILLQTYKMFMMIQRIKMFKSFPIVPTPIIEIKLSDKMSLCVAEAPSF